MRTTSDLTDFILIFLCLVGSYLIHINSFVDMDVAWHVEGAKRLLSGGNYLLNVFDDNSPFVFMFYFPVVWLHQFFSIAYEQLIILYVLFFNTVSLIIIKFILQKTFGAYQFASQKIIFYTLVFCLIFLPAFSLGQREMILINFVLPYFLILIFSTQYPSLRFNKLFCSLCAIFAAFGVLQNIIFIFVIIAMDLFRYTKLRKFLIYQIVFYLIIAVAVIAVTFIYPEYLHFIIPLLFCYTSGFNSDRVELVLYSYVVLLSLILFFIRIKSFYKNIDILMTVIAAIISLIIYLFEQKIWYSHLYPSLVFSILFIGLMIVKSYQSLDKKSVFNVNVLTICLGIAIISVMVREVVLSALYEIKEFHQPNSIRRQWVTYADAHFKNKKVFYLIVNDEQAYTLPIYVNTTAVSPWFNPWFVPSILQKEKNKMGYFCNPVADTQLFIYLIAKTLTSTSPDFVVINIPHAKVPLQGFNQIFTAENIAILLQNYYIYDYFLNNIIYKRK